jgi:tetratricopeptide (TPR) repeat protein
MKNPAASSRTATNPALAPLPEKFQQALALQHRGQLAKARFILEKMVKAQPKHGDALNLLGVIAAQTKNPRSAVQFFGKAIAVDLNNAAAYCNRGLALHELGQLNAALTNYDRAIAIKADYADAHFGRGNVLKDLQQPQAALAGYDQGIAINPDFAQAYVNRGFVLKELGQLAAALDSYDRAIALKPGYVKAYCNRAFTSLLGADFDHGWVDYEWRRKLETSPAAGAGTSSPPLPEFSEESLAGKTILLRCEQGLGDTLQFCRYAKLVSDLGARVIMEVQKPLLALLASLQGVSQLVAKGSALPDFDHECPLMSLPLAFKTRLETIPCFKNYLSSDAGKVAQWRTRLGENPRQPRVGLVWSGSRTNYNDANRSILLADVIRYLPAECRYIGLQKDVRDADRKALECNPSVLNAADGQSDFSDAAALCECMDVVISVDTSVAHLAGALGKRTWILLPFSPDWRWLLDRDDSPWYPAVKLYRQSNRGDWSGVLERVRADLLQLVEWKTADAKN